MIKRFIAVFLGLIALTSCSYINSEIYRKQTDVLYRQGQQLYKSGKYTEAQEVFSRLIEKDPNHFEGTFALGATMYLLGRMNDARELFEKAVKMNDSSKDARIWLIDTCIRLKDFKKAAEISEKLPEESRREIETRMNLAMSQPASLALLPEQEMKMLDEAIEMIGNKNYSEALKPLLKITNKYPNDLQVCLYLLICYRSIGNIKDADELAEGLLKLREYNLYIDPSVLKDKKGLISLLESTVNDCVSGCQDLLTGLVLAQNRLPDRKSLEYLDKGLSMIKIDDLDFQASKKIAGIYWKLQQIRKALQYYEMSLSKKPDQLDLLQHMVSIYLYHEGDRKKAEEYTRQILKYDPSNKITAQISYEQ